MISTLRINYHIHRAMEFFGVFLAAVALAYIVIFAHAHRQDLVLSSFGALAATAWWCNRMSRHAIKAKNAFREKLDEYERLYGKLS